MNLIMKKRRLFILVSILLVLISMSASASESLSSKTSSDSESDPAIYLETDGKILSYQYFSVEEDFEGKPALLLHFEYTNNTDNPAMASTDFYTSAYQDNKPLQPGVLKYDSEYSQEVSNLLVSLQDQKSLPVCFVYSLSDLTSDVEIHVQSFLDFYSEPQKLTISPTETATPADASLSSEAWEKKYYALLSKYKTLQQEYNNLKKKLEESAS